MKKPIHDSQNTISLQLSLLPLLLAMMVFAMFVMPALLWMPPIGVILPTGNLQFSAAEMAYAAGVGVVWVALFFAWVARALTQRSSLGKT